MNNLVVGEITIPICFVQSISWSKGAKTVTHSGGYISARGFEPCEISVRVVVDFGVCTAYGLDPIVQFDNIQNIVTNRKSIPGVFYLAGYSIYPELEFALSSINKTYLYDSSGSTSSVECDLVFSGVKAVKNVVRERALDFSGVPSTMPGIILSVGGKELVIKDSISIQQFITTPDSISLTLGIGSDLDISSREGFLTKLSNGGEVIADLPQGQTKYYIIQSDLVEETLSLTGSIFPPKAAKTLIRTYQETRLKSIIEDIAKEAGVDCTCLVDAQIDYYRTFGTPLECLRELSRSAGFILSFRQGKITCVDVPEELSPTVELDYLDLEEDQKPEPLRGVLWFDGLNQDSAGTIDSSSSRIYSVFSSKDSFAQKCLNLIRYNQNSLTVNRDILETIDTHSVVSIRSNDQSISCMAEFIEFDWVENSMKAELHYPE